MSLPFLVYFVPFGGSLIQSTTTSTHHVLDVFCQVQVDAAQRDEYRPVLSLCVVGRGCVTIDRFDHCDTLLAVDQIITLVTLNQYSTPAPSAGTTESGGGLSSACLSAGRTVIFLQAALFLFGILHIK